MKNVLLLFLSDVKINKGSISEAHYENIEGENTQTTNESAIRYLIKDFPLDKIFIFASKKIRGEIDGYLGADGKPKTHLQFSLERFRKFLPEVECFVFNYNEHGSDNDNLKSIAEMAEQVQKFAEGEEVNLHVDLTGGMRHVNMMMLELTRLLEYSGLKVGKILYSNYKGSTKPSTVEEIQNVYDLFQLIAGVEEFVNFGSIKALDFYYKGKREKISVPLKKLIDAMKNFSEAIKLCHYGQFQKSIEELHDAVHDFDKQKSTDVEDILMARLIGRIRKNYHDLIAIREKDDLQVIRWCLDNDYLQQALTLYTERIPEYLGEKKILIQTEEETKRLAELTGKDDMKRNRWFYLFSDFKTPEEKLEGGKQIFFKAVKSATKLIIAKKSSFNFDEWLAALNKELAVLNLYCEDEKDFRAQFETLFKIFKEPQLLLDLSSNKLKPISKLFNNLPEETAQEFKSAMWGMKRCKILANFFNNVMTNDDVPKYFLSCGFIELMNKYPKAVKMYELLVEKVFSVSISTETFLSIADKYFRIKDERNHSNHAREDYGEFKTAEKLRNVMSEGLSEIQNNLPTQ